MNKAIKKRASGVVYTSPKQLTLDCFKTPFEQKLNPKNRWVVIGQLIPWDDVCNLYLKNVGVSQTGRPPLSPRIVIGSLIIKHMCNLDDRETVEQISENIYMQYFLGYSSFSSEPPFDASLFVEMRKRLGIESLNAINERIIGMKRQMQEKEQKDEEPPDQPDKNPEEPVENKGWVIFDATACPQDIAYPTDLDILSDAREKAEELIDKLYQSELHGDKPRTYRMVARKRYLQTAQKKNKSRKEIRKAVGSQLRFLRRDLNAINRLLDAYDKIPLTSKEYKYLLVINHLCNQQKQMYTQHTHSIEHSIVSIHQPHVRPIVRGKSQAKVEFGSKIHVSLVGGIAFLDQLSWEAFNEGVWMMGYIEKYKERFGYYPAEVLADQIYCTRDNRGKLKELGIKLLAKPLGRPSAVQVHVSPGERNPIEGKFGQAKTGYGLNRIYARLQVTSETWIACIIMVLNLVKLAGQALYCLMLKWFLSFSAKMVFSLTSTKKQFESIYYKDFSLMAVPLKCRAA
ncbi:MAG TPA: IS5 family transposase [Marinilabiliales bacterium]|nr:MAG: transposase [Bacteroidetes bacterium GWC2_40_13]OFX72804.1 MAG: transposase [Bacteroidetes bacterium GWD2_40_43]OFX92567.1 MAG: transposase [Bacteroidetes bacterium GWE2_40_63]HAM97208.1 IS5 family transposase [Marinilabiliales bacterium]HAZ01601.1 IS5 family transposase [Marinilabiliales bacterium]